MKRNVFLIVEDNPSSNGAMRSSFVDGRTVFRVQNSTYKAAMAAASRVLSAYDNLEDTTPLKSPTLKVM